CRRDAPLLIEAIGEGCPSGRCHLAGSARPAAGRILGSPSGEETDVEPPHTLRRPSRRQFVLGVGALGLLGACQQLSPPAPRPRMVRVGVLTNAPASSHPLEAFRS